ncbi:hypothetical protein SprV_0401517700 [Sparganum proliferum]
MRARVIDNRAVSGAFAVGNRVRQGCVLASTLFSLMFSAMLMDVDCDERPGIRITYTTDGHLNNRRMQAPTRLSTATIHDLLFAEDCALNCTAEANMQWSIDLFAYNCGQFRLTINTDKTVVMHQQLPNAGFSVRRIHVNRNEPKTVDSFTYLRKQCTNNLATSTSPPTNTPTITTAADPATTTTSVTGDQTVDALRHRSPESFALSQPLRRSQRPAPSTPRPLALPH